MKRERGMKGCKGREGEMRMWGRVSGSRGDGGRDAQGGSSERTQERRAGRD